MKTYFYSVEFTARIEGNITNKWSWGSQQFDLSKPLEPQLIEHVRSEGVDIISSVRLISFTPLELDSSNHTEKLIELWRIERTAGEYYGGMNTGVYINKELAKLGITL